MTLDDLDNIFPEMSFNNLPACQFPSKSYEAILRNLKKAKRILSAPLGAAVTMESLIMGISFFRYN